MKFIPLDSFSALNAFFQGVEAQGCCITLRLEAYTCRHTKEERHTATNIAAYQNQVQLTPPISPAPTTSLQMGMPSPMDMPPPLVLGSSSSIDGVAAGTASPVAPEDIDDRLVYFVTALNTLYENDGYDFSVLRESDFVQFTEQQLRMEVQNTLDSLPEPCGPAVQRFWPTIQEVVENEEGGCEYYEFASHSCDPLADTTVYSRHYFLFHRKKKVLVVLIEYGQSNPYRGDDGLPQAGEAVGRMAGGWDSPPDASTPDPLGDSEEEAYAGGKNKEFYGYY